MTLDATGRLWQSTSCGEGLSPPAPEKRFHDDGAISEVKLWLVSQVVPGSAHPFKYSLFYGYPGRRAVAYDNERGKGDHRHRDGEEAPYPFESLDKLLADFEADVAALRAEENKDG